MRWGEDKRRQVCRRAQTGLLLRGHFWEFSRPIVYFVSLCISGERLLNGQNSCWLGQIWIQGTGAGLALLLAIKSLKLNVAGRKR